MSINQQYFALKSVRDEALVKLNNIAIFKEFQHRVNKYDFDANGNLLLYLGTNEKCICPIIMDKPKKWADKSVIFTFNKFRALKQYYNGHSKYTEMFSLSLDKFMQFLKDYGGDVESAYFREIQYSKKAEYSDIDGRIDYLVEFDYGTYPGYKGARAVFKIYDNQLIRDCMTYVCTIDTCKMLEDLDSQMYRHFNDYIVDTAFDKFMYKGDKVMKLIGSKKLHLINEAGYQVMQQITNEYPLFEFIANHANQYYFLDNGTMLLFMLSKSLKQMPEIGDEDCDSDGKGVTFYFDISDAINAQKAGFDLVCAYEFKTADYIELFSNTIYEIFSNTNEFIQVSNQDFLRAHGIRQDKIVSANETRVVLYDYRIINYCLNYICSFGKNLIISDIKKDALKDIDYYVLDSEECQEEEVVNE